MGRLLEILLFKWVRPHHFVIILTLLFLTAFVASYAISVTLGHVEALIPYISDTGAKQPESSVFGFFLSLGAGAAMTCMYIRHQQFSELSLVESPIFFVLNDVSLVFAILVTIGILLVASFQETSLMVVHIIGAFLAFGFGVLYSWIHSFLSFKEEAMGTSSRAKSVFRLLLAIFSTIFFVSTMVTASVALHQGKDKNETIMKWKKSDKGFDTHLVSAFSEWFMALCFVLYFITFYNDFKKVHLHLKIARIYSHSSSFLIAGDIPSPVEA